ncbi:hypothetical protein F4678DRAFT_37897 [Xylaria arbuscula]|nr:hypothetical protein F4678DRAFT_37897 [Xylaria arbuscula]
MCQYKCSSYWGYDICSHEYPSPDNQWGLCYIPGQGQGQAYDCPFASYTRSKVGEDYCEFCLYDNPPDHPPVTEFFQGFANLRAVMEDLNVNQATRQRYTRDIQGGLLEIRDRAANAGVNNNFYDDVRALYDEFHQRMAHALADSMARREARRRRREQELQGGQ